MGCVSNVDLEDPARGRRCGRGEIGVGVCVVGRGELASDGVLKNVL